MTYDCEKWVLQSFPAPKQVKEVCAQLYYFMWEWHSNCGVWNGLEEWQEEGEHRDLFWVGYA
jgi:hypothetical protein